MNETKTAAEMVASALTEIKEHSTKARLTYTPTLETTLNFKSFQDPILQQMAAAAGRMIRDIKSKTEPYWLSYLGTSGAGKSYLARKIKSEVWVDLSWHRELLNPVQFQSWSKLLEQYRSGDYWRLNDIRECNFVVLDDIGVEGTRSSFGDGKLYETITARERKWTVITSNLTLDQISKLDVRLSSRLIRESNLVINVDTIDYALRPKQ